MGNIQSHGSPFSKTVGSVTVATATIAAVSGTTYYITDIAGSSDLAGATLVVSDGATAIWSQRIGTTPYSQPFISPLKATAGNSISVTVTGTATCFANISGFSLP